MACVTDDKSRIADVCNDTGHATRHRFADDVGKGFADGRRDQEVHSRHQTRYIVALADEMHRRRQAGALQSAWISS